MKKRSRILLAFFVLLVILAGTSFLLRNTPPTIPQFDEARFILIGDRDIKRVEIIDEDLGQLRRLIETTERDRFPAKQAVLGTLELRASGATILTIQIFSNQSGSGSLEISDRYYLGYDQQSFEKILGRAKSIDTQ